MTGCLLLGVGAAILAAKWFHHRRHGHTWWGRGCHGRWRGGPGTRWEDDDPWERGRHARGGFWMRLLSRRLDATPGQEKVMREAARDLREAASKVRDEADRTRSDLASVIRKASLDEVQLGELFARHDRVLEDLRKAFVGSAAKIHEALDEEQREELADIIESGDGGRRWGWRRRRRPDAGPSGHAGLD